MWSSWQPSGPELPTPISRPTLTSSAHTFHSFSPPFPRWLPVSVFLVLPPLRLFPPPSSFAHPPSLSSPGSCRAQRRTPYLGRAGLTDCATLHLYRAHLAPSVACVSSSWPFSPSDPISRTSSIHRRISEPTQINSIRLYSTHLPSSRHPNNPSTQSRHERLAKLRTALAT